MKIKTRQGIYLCLAAALLFGILAGVALPEVFRMREGTYAGFFSLYGMKKMQEMEVLLLPIFGYLLSSRLRTLLFLWMSSYTPLGLWLHLFFTGWLGCSGGMLLSLFALKQGVQGIGLFFCCTLPQWIFYGLQWKKELQLFLSHTLPREDFSAGVFPYPSRRAKIDWIAMVLYCISGCAAETVLGLWSVKIFLKILTGA